MTTISRRRLAALIPSPSLMAPAIARGDVYPSRPVKVIVPWAAGRRSRCVRPFGSSAAQ